MASASAPTDFDDDSLGILPSQFLRERRPEIYSDTAGRTDYELDRAVGYSLEAWEPVILRRRAGKD